MYLLFYKKIKQKKYSYIYHVWWNLKLLLIFIIIIFFFRGKDVSKKIRSFYLGSNRNTKMDIVFVDHSNGKVFYFDTEEQESMTKWLSECTQGLGRMIGNYFLFLSFFFWFYFKKHGKVNIYDRAYSLQNIVVVVFKKLLKNDLYDVVFSCA